MLRYSENNFRRSVFRGRQLQLIASAVVLMLGGIAASSILLLALATLMIQVGSTEALRFRKTGRYWRTCRALWIGATPIDAQQRYLLNGWVP